MDPSDLIEFHSVLRIADILAYRLQVVFVVNAFPIAAVCPYRPVEKHRPMLAQSSRAIGLQLIANRITRIPRGRDYYVDMISSSVDLPQPPAAVITMTLAFLFDNRTLFRREEDDIVLQAFLTPFGEQWLR